MQNPPTPLLLSILTPAVPSRWVQVRALVEEIARQVGAAGPVEHLVLLDNKRRTVGEKRDALLRAARGQYVAFVDDDDWIAPDYVAAILAALAEERPNVITFRQLATVNDVAAIIDFRLGQANEAFPHTNHPTTPPVVRRAAWHVCAWQRALALQSHFPPTNYGEDWAFAAPLNALATTEHHIDRVLHYYRHSSAATEAPPPVAAES